MVRGLAGQENPWSRALQDLVGLVLGLVAG
jgi:hypothetical protein